MTDPSTHDTTARGRPDPSGRPRRGVAVLRAGLRRTVLATANSLAFALGALGACVARDAGAQGVAGATPDDPWSVVPDTTVASEAALGPAVVRVRTARERALASRVAAAAATARGLRLVVSLEARELRVLRDADTLLVAPVAVGRDSTLTFEGKTWRFTTPLGIRRVLEKKANPVWIPPDWHYVEVAHQEGLQVRRLARDTPVTLDDGERLAVRGDVAGILRSAGTFDTLAEGEELIFGDTLFIPPYGTRNRRIAGQLGRYRFDLGNGYLLHGTPDATSIGTAATHGCLRLHDGDLEWLYRNVPVGTRVYIH